MIKPVGERVLIKRIQQEDKGFELAKVRSQELTEGEVVAIGKMIEEMPAQIGDIVIIDKYAGEEYKEGDDLYKIVDYKYILAVK